MRLSGCLRIAIRLEFEVLLTIHIILNAPVPEPTIINNDQVLPPTNVELWRVDTGSRETVDEHPTSALRRDDSNVLTPVLTEMIKNLPDFDRDVRTVLRAGVRERIEQFWICPPSLEHISEVTFKFRYHIWIRCPVLGTLNAKGLSGSFGHTLRNDHADVRDPLDEWQIGCRLSLNWLDRLRCRARGCQCQ